MEEPNRVEKLLKHVEEYAETRFDLVILNVQDKMGSVLSSIVSIVILWILSIFVLLFVSIGAAWLIGDYFNSASIGFFSIAGFDLIIAIVVFFNREKWVKVPITNALIKKINFHEKD